MHRVERDGVGELEDALAGQHALLQRPAAAHPGAAHDAREELGGRCAARRALQELGVKDEDLDRGGVGGGHLVDGAGAEGGVLGLHGDAERVHPEERGEAGGVQREVLTRPVHG